MVGGNVRKEGVGKKEKDSGIGGIHYAHNKGSISRKKKGGSLRGEEGN